MSSPPPATCSDVSKLLFSVETLSVLLESDSRAGEEGRGDWSRETARNSSAVAWSSSSSMSCAMFSIVSLLTMPADTLCVSHRKILLSFGAMPFKIINLICNVTYNAMYNV